MCEDFFCPFNWNRARMIDNLLTGSRVRGVAASIFIFAI